jgi:hypothetical protein
VLAARRVPPRSITSLRQAALAGRFSGPTSPMNSIAISSQ